MYLTAQRVTKPSDGSTGVNSFLHEHQKDIGISDSWDESDLNRIANQEPGNLAARDTQLPPGGNRVLSFLEVVSEDSITLGEIRSVLKQFQERASQERFLNRNGVAVYFSLVHGTSSQEKIELAILVGAAVSLLENWAKSPTS